MAFVDEAEESYPGGPLVVAEPGEDFAVEPDEPDERAETLQRLLALIDSPNIAADETLAEKLGPLGDKVCRETQIDINSRDKWERRTKAGMELAMQEVENKTYPWPGAANVKYPLMTSAAIQFQARAYPAIVSGKNVVKAQVEGSDPGGKKRAKGDRVAAHMSWQLLTEMPEWEAEVDRMLLALPIEGCAFKKTYFDQAKGRNCSDYVSAMDLIVNHSAKSLEVAPRITHQFPLYPYQIRERINAGVYLDFDWGTASGTDANNDVDAPHWFYEQHRREDLDGDGYPEPYIVTVHKDSQKVVRIKACFSDKTVIVGNDGAIIRIEPKKYFTKVPFIPNPDGGFYDIGFGWLLSPMNAAVNTVLNQLLDAGHLANTGGGFIGNGLRLTGGTMRFVPGEYKEADATGGSLRENIVPLTFPGPNPVLFELLGLLIEAGREIASVKDVLTGDQPAANTPATTTLALIEQGLKVFTAIYKRIHRALKDEFGKLYELNREHFDLEGYLLFHDMAPDVLSADYQGDPMDIVPVSDPTVVSDMQRLARAEFLGQFKGEPGINPMAITRRQWDAAGIENQEELIAPQTGPDPATMAQLAKLTAEIEEMKSKVLKNTTAAIRDIAEAEKAEAGAQIDQYRAVVEGLQGSKDGQAESAPNGGAMEQPQAASGLPGVPGIPAALPGVDSGGGQGPMAPGAV